MTTPPGDRGLERKVSKSKLAKQQEVEDEEPPCRDKVKIPETRIESFEDKPENTGGLSQSPPFKSKVLVRSHAMCGDDDTKLKARSLEKQEKQGSSKSGSAGSSLSRDSSNELYTDSTGINLEDFIVSTLHKNAKDRQMLLQLEEELIRFVQDTTKQVQRFPPMSSYNRMLVHRIAAFFGLDHNVDNSGTCVVVNKTANSRTPDVPFSEYIKHDNYTEEPKRVLRRDVQSYEEVARGSDLLTDIRKARSFEDREEEYERARARIFNQDSSSSAEIIESPISGYSSDSVHAHSSTTGETGARPWSSTDSGSLDVPSLPGRGSLTAMQKAGSFGGVPTTYRGGTEALRGPPRRSNTDSSKTGADLSPGSMGRRPQPVIPENVVVSAGVVSPAVAPPGQQVIFAVSNWEQVPAGAIIFNPQTGQPYLNPDGTVYRHIPQYGTASASTAYVQPFLHTDPNVLCGAVQSLSVQPGVAGHAAASPAPSAPSPATGFPASHQQVLAYVMPHSSRGSESSSATPPPPSSGQPIVVQMPPYMQGASVQYPSSVQYVMPSPQVVTYTEAGSSTAPATQITYSQSGVSGGYPVYPPQVLVMMQRAEQETSYQQPCQVPCPTSATASTFLPASPDVESVSQAEGEDVVESEGGS